MTSQKQEYRSLTPQNVKTRSVVTSQKNNAHSQPQNLKTQIEARVKAFMELRTHMDKCKASAEKQKGDMSKYGTHPSITCDGCGQEPMMGFRWKCIHCKNHDLCGTCHDAFLNGKLPHNNRRQTLSVRLVDHEFNVYTEKGSFEAMMKGTDDKKKQVAVKKKIKPNAKCPLCSSGRKYKKCCGRPKKSA